MGLTKDQRAGLAQNINNVLMSTLQNLKTLEGRGSMDAMESRQLALLTIAVVTLVDIILSQTPDSIIMVPN